MISGFVFLLSLPLAVYTLAGLFLLMDLDNRRVALLHLTFRISLVVGLLVVIPERSRIWVGIAFGLVSALHVASSVLLRAAIKRGYWITDRFDSSGKE